MGSTFFHVNLFLVNLFPCLSFSGVEKGNLFPVWKKATFFQSTFFHVYHFPGWKKATFFQCGKRQPFSSLPFSMSTFSCQPFSMSIIFGCCKIQSFSSVVKFNLFPVK